MSQILEYIIAGIILIVVLSVVLFFLKITVAVLFYIFIGALLISGIAYLYNKFLNK